MKRVAMKAMALASAIASIGCVAVSVRILASVSRDWANINSLQVGVAGLGFAAAVWGAFSFGRYSGECWLRASGGFW